MYSPGALCSPEDIYFTGRHVLLFGMIQKKFLATACTLRALCTLRGGIFFTGMHVLSGRLYSPGGIYFTSRHVLLFGMI